MATSRERGFVKWFHNSKGYGFIRLGGSVPTRDDGIFVHHSQIMGKDSKGAIVPLDGYRQLFEDQEVEFDIQQCERGFEARRVVALTEPPAK